MRRRPMGVRAGAQEHRRSCRGACRGIGFGRGIGCGSLDRIVPNNRVSSKTRKAMESTTPPSSSSSGTVVGDIEDLGVCHSAGQTRGEHEATAAPLCPRVPMYGPCTVRGLQVGEKKLWCSCGLSKKQPWCDGSHIGTPFKPLKWVVPGTLKDGKPQTLYSICNCKYTAAPPYCDAKHTSLPLEVKERQASCKSPHEDGIKICAACGWVPMPAAVAVDRVAAADPSS